MHEQGPLFGDILLKLGLATEHQVQEALALQALTGQRLGEALISLGYVSREQLQSALFEALGIERGTIDRPLLGELLLRLKYVQAKQLAGALDRQKRDGRRLGELLVESNACSYRQVYEALGLQQRISMRTGENASLLAPRPDGGDSPAPARKTLVMVVDDSPLACGLVEDGLSERGYDVVTFQDPFLALEQVFHLKPDIILTDLEMPGLDGAELCRRLKDGPARSSAVIILTANDADTQRVAGLRAGADDYVRKGASMDELAARIDTVVRRTGETERMRKLFARYTSDDVVEEVLKSGEVVLTGEKREVTVLFADIRGFTSLADGLPPERVMAVLNDVLARLADVVLTCGGTLDKFLGDGLMAVFGAPVRHEDDALRAVQAAQMMMESMRELNAAAHAHPRGVGETNGASADVPELQLGIGINSGTVVVGNVGSARRTEYTCIGDAVNVAARLCAQAAPCEILVGERTHVLVNDVSKFESLPPVRLKGKAQPVPLFRLTSGPRGTSQESEEVSRTAS